MTVGVMDDWETLQFDRVYFPSRGFCRELKETKNGT